VLLGYHIGNPQHHVKNSVDFVCTLGCLRAGPQDIKVNYDVVSLFIRMLIRKAMSLLGQHFKQNTLKLFCLVLTSYFSS
jgi:hypothetical protein